MTTRQWYLVLSVLALLVSAKAAHWLITPINHPAAGTPRTLGVYLMLFGGMALAFWASQRAKLVPPAARPL